MLPPPFHDRDFTCFTPLTLVSIDSRRLVTSDSTVRAELLFIENDTVIAGRFSDGVSFTGNRGNTAQPSNDSAMNAMITENEDM